ncbi:MAG: hypothetical protein JSR46_04405, partial [Verrucomicrobia bacterium]|nr:hypothetical protein [Verrucomicrobiota bacterium]
PLKFFCQDDIVPQNSNDFLNSIKTVETSLNQIAVAQQTIAINLQQRNVQHAKVAIQCSAWIQELWKLSSSIEECRKRIQDQIDQLPFLDKEINVQGSQELSVLEQQCYRLNEKNSKLTLLINSQEHQDTLTFYKEVIYLCEKEKTPSPDLLNSLLNQIKERMTNQKEKLLHLDRNLRRSIIAIHREILDYLSYAASTCSDSQSIQMQIESLKPTDISLTKSQINNNLTHQDTQYQESFSAVTLPKERMFKHDSHLPYFVNYFKIKDIIPELHDIAKGLYQIEMDLERNIKDAWQLKTTYAVPNYPALLKILESSIQTQRDNLCKTPFCAAVRAGLLYTEGLFTQIAEIEQTYEFYFKLTTTSWQQVVTLQKLFYKYLYPDTSSYIPQVMVNYTSISTLHSVITQLHNVSKSMDDDPFLAHYKARVAKAIATSLACIGKTAFLLTPQEQGVYDKVGAGSVLFDTPSPEKAALKMHQDLVKCLLSKKMVEHLHFTTHRFDLHLDITLTKLTTNEKYSDYFSTITREDNNFEKLINHYRGIVGLGETDQNHLLQLCDITSLLQQIINSDGTDAILTFFTYCQMVQRLREAKETVTNQERWEGFLASIEPQVKAIKDKYNFNYVPNSAEIPNGDWIHEEGGEKTVFTILIEAIWGKSQYKQQNAMQLIHTAILSYQSKLDEMDTKIQYLLMAFAWKYFHMHYNDRMHIVDNCDEFGFSRFEKIYLPQFFAAHLKNPDQWTGYYTMATVEYSFYSFQNRKGARDIIEKSVLRQPIEEHRNPTFNNFSPIWKHIMMQYPAVKEWAENGGLKRQQNTHACDEYLRMLNEACDSGEIDDSPHYKHIFTKLLQEAKNMFAIPI